MSKHMVHTVKIWRNPRTKQWHHQFIHENGRQLTRQSEGVTKKAGAIRSAQTAYGLGELIPDREAPATPELFWPMYRDDVRVLVKP
jgi:hypothetical protein